jgi:aminoglycoside phosphotransferase (APT) family kinase protein
MVRQGPDGWRVTGIIDWERAFYGDPLAEIVSLVLSESPEPKSAVLDALAKAGGPSARSEAAQRRLALYRAYLWLIMIVEAGPRGFAVLPMEDAGRLLMRDLRAATGEGGSA